MLALHCAQRSCHPQLLCWVITSFSNHVVGRNVQRESLIPSFTYLWPLQLSGRHRFRYILQVFPERWKNIRRGKACIAEGDGGDGIPPQGNGEETYASRGFERR